jgi:iron(III) transport system permease protein
MPSRPVLNKNGPVGLFGPMSLPRARGAKTLFLVVLLLPVMWPVCAGVAGAVSAVVGVSSGSGTPLWPDARVWGLLFYSAVLSLAVSLVVTALAMMYAVILMVPLSRRWQLGLWALLATLFCFGTVAHLLAWRVVFPAITGGVAGWGVAVLTLTLRYLPLAVVLLAAGLAGLDQAELDSAQCAGGPRAVWAVARRRLSRLAAMAMVAVATLVFAESELPPLLGVHVYAEEFLSQIALEPDARAATALGWPLMAVAVFAALFLARMPYLRATAAGAVHQGWLGQWHHAPRWLRSVLPWVAVVLAALPVLLLTTGAGQASGRWPAQAGSALVSSLWVAVLSGMLAVLWGWVLSATALRVGGWAVACLNPCLWLAMLWPTALTGLSVAALNLPGVAGHPTALVLAHTLRLAPFAAWMLLALGPLQASAPLQQLQMMGARGWVPWRRVRWPMLRAAAIGAGLMCAGLSLAELTATVLTVPPGMETVILRLYNLLHYGDQRGVMVLALLQGLSVASFVGMGLWWFGRRGAGNR